MVVVATRSRNLAITASSFGHAETRDGSFVKYLNDNDFHTRARAGAKNSQNATQIPAATIS
jgi:hypothetical protein